MPERNVGGRPRLNPRVEPGVAAQTHCYIGVTYRKRSGSFEVKGHIHRRSHHIGTYGSAEAGARAYDAWARATLGPKAKVNFPEPT